MYPDIKTLEEILIGQSYISKEDSQAATKGSKSSDEYISSLIRDELLSKTLLGQALAEYYKLPFVDLSSIAINRDQLAQIPEETAREQRVVYLKASDQVVAIATDTPSSVDLKKLQKLFPDKKIRIAYTLPEYIEANFTSYMQALPTRFAEIIKSGSSIAPTIVDEIIKDALRYKASDIHFEPMTDDVIVRFRVDGNLREAGRLPRQFYDNVLNRIKVESGMRIDEHFTAQDGSIRHENNEGITNLRVSLIPTVQGEKVVMRVLGSYVQGFSLNDIGLTDAQEAMVMRHANRPFGMILTVGPTGSGKTTTLYALLKLLSKPNVNVTTIEDPVEYRMQGINQIQVQEQTNMTFSRGLRAIVRQDPDVILVGEIRDQETAEISVNAALTGHLLLSTFHANNASTAIPRLIEMGIEPFLLSSTLELVVAQRLARKICPHCRHSVSVDSQIGQLKPSEEVKKHFHNADTIYTGKGCNYCNGSGYLGRIALFEFIELTPGMQELVTKQPSMHDIEHQAKKDGMQTMFEDGVEKVKSGVTTLEELIRVVPPPTRGGSHERS